MDAPTCLHTGPAPFLPRADPAPCLPRARARARRPGCPWTRQPVCTRAPPLFYLSRTPPPCARTRSGRGRALRSSHEGSVPSQWRARALTRGRAASVAALAGWRAPATHLRARRPYPGFSRAPRAAHTASLTPPAARTRSRLSLAPQPARLLTLEAKKVGARQKRGLWQAAPRVRSPGDGG